MCIIVTLVTLYPANIVTLVTLFPGNNVTVVTLLAGNTVTLVTLFPGNIVNLGYNTIPRQHYVTLVTTLVPGNIMLHW